MWSFSPYLMSVEPRSGKVAEMSRENWTADDHEQFAKFMAAAPEELSAHQLEVLRRHFGAAAKRIAEREHGLSAQ
ncbi:hypothetical protein JCM9803A_11950 [Rhodococcus erythropolis]